MKVVVSSEGIKKESILDKRFGRAKNFILFDSDRNVYEVIDNTAKEGAHGAGPKAAQLVIENNADVLITGNLGPKAYAVIDETNIESFRSKEVSIQKNIEYYLANKLEKIKSYGPSHAGN